MSIPVVTSCERCPALCSNRTQIVNGRGPEDAKIVFVGEGPGVDEDESGKPFMGKSGRILATLMKQVGIDPSTVYLTNATRCLPPRNRPNPTPEEVGNCHDYLIEELRAINPAVIVILGKQALSSLYKINTAIASVMGFTLYNDDLPNIPMIATYHPSYIMRGNWSDTALVLAHLQKVKRLSEKTGDEYGLGSYTGIKTLEELRALRDYLLGSDFTLLSVDTETCGLSSLDDDFLCVSFTAEEGLGYSVPILHRGKTIVYEDKKLTKKRMNEIIKEKGEPPTDSEKEWLVKQDEDNRIIKIPKEIYIPEIYWSEEDLPEVIQIIDEILRSDIPKAGQNIGFDLRMLERNTNDPVVAAATAFGFYVNNLVHDTKMLSTLLQENLPASLTVMASYWTDIPYYEKDIVEFKSKMWELEDEILWVYGGADVDVVARLVPPLYKKVKEEGSDFVYHNISIPLIRCATKLEERGVLVDLEYFDKLCDYYKNNLEEQKQSLTELMGRELETPTYYKTLQTLLFEELELPLPNRATDSAVKKCKNCKKDSPCSPNHSGTGGDELEELNKRHPHPILPIILDIKTSEKFYSNYLEGGKGGFRRFIREDGRLHPTWNAARASTGRFTCENPNLMNPPKNTHIDSDEYDIHSKDAIRSMFIAPPGFVVMNADWSQLELWVLAYETGDETLLKLLRGGEDVHSYVGRKLCELGISQKFPLEAFDPHLDLVEWRKAHPLIREDAKTFVYGISYQLTIEGAAIKLNCSVEEASSIFTAFETNIFPSLSSRSARIREEILRNYTTDNIFHRRRHFVEVPILQSLNYQYDIDSVIRVGNNFGIQSGGHDLHSLAHIHHENTESLISRAKPVLEMHDNLMMEAREEDVEQTAFMVKQSWENVARNTVLPDGTVLGWEIPVEVKWGPSFGKSTHTLTAGGKLLKEE